MDRPRNYHAKWSQSDSETPLSCAITDMWNLKKKKGTMNFFAEQILSHRLWKTCGFQRRQVGEWGDGLGVWDGHAIKLGCDGRCTPINVIKLIELKNIYQFDSRYIFQMSSSSLELVFESINSFIESFLCPSCFLSRNTHAHKHTCTQTHMHTHMHTNTHAHTHSPFPHHVVQMSACYYRIYLPVLGTEYWIVSKCSLLHGALKLRF